VFDAMALGASGKLELLNFSHIMRRAEKETADEKLVCPRPLDGLAMEFDYQLAFFTSLVAVDGGARLSARHLFVVVYEESLSAQVNILELGSLSEVDDSSLFLPREGFCIGRKGDQSYSDQHQRNQTKTLHDRNLPARGGLL
jgi:hypothetical protein